MRKLTENLKKKKSKELVWREKSEVTNTHIVNRKHTKGVYRHLWVGWCASSEKGANIFFRYCNNNKSIKQIILPEFDHVIVTKLSEENELNVSPHYM